MTWPNLVDFWTALFGSCAVLLFVGCVVDELADRRRRAKAVDEFADALPVAVPAAYIPHPRRAEVTAPRGTTAD